MSYIHISNLYKCQDLLLFRECFAMEKIHGTSTRISWKDGVIGYAAGGESYPAFKMLFDPEKLAAGFSKLGADVIVYGEAYGGSQQGMRLTYGDKLKFIGFDVQIGGLWLSVPNAEDVVTNVLGLEFVHYVKIPATVEAMDVERDKPSVQAIRNGITEPKPREGIVCHPLVEFTKNNGDRVIVKHKRDEYQERATPQKIVDPAKLKVLTEAKAIADEWVTVHRLEHVLQKIPQPYDMPQIPLVIKAIQEDVLREAKGEIVESKDALRAIASKARELFVTKVRTVI